jgi:guanine deaminase
MEHEKYMRMAIEKAREGLRSGQAPFGCCIVKNNEILVCEHNMVIESCDITNHAEIYAIRQACKLLDSIDLTDCIVYSTNEPCPMCFSACHWAKIDQIIYGTSIEDAKALGFREISISNKKMNLYVDSPIQVKGNFLRFDNLELLTEWKRSSNRRSY